MLSASFAVSGSGHYEIEAVREKSYAGRLAGEAKAFRHPLSPLQEEVNRVIVVSTYAMIPLAILLLIVSLKIRSVGLQSAAETATAGLVTLIPEGLVLLMSVTFAVAAVRLARRDTLIQQMSATESLASVDTICVDKTGTLTEGELRLKTRSSSPTTSTRRSAPRCWDASRRAPATATRPWRRSPSATPATPGQVTAEVPFSSEWKWSGVSLDGNGAGAGTFVLGAPDILERQRLAGAAAGDGGEARRGDGGRAARRRLRPQRRAAPRRRRGRARRRGSNRWRWSCWRRRCARTPPRRSPSCATRKST